MNDNFQIIETFFKKDDKNRKYCKCKCLSCKNISIRRYDSLKRGFKFRCKFCSNSLKNKQQILDDIFESNTLKILDYKNGIVTVFCNNCKKENSTRWYTIVHSKGCKYCSGNNTYIYDKRPELKNFIGEDCSFVKIHSNKKIKTKCTFCGDESLKIISNLYKNGFTCSKCGIKISYSEKFISKFLDIFNINYERQYNPSWIKNKKYTNKGYKNSIDMVLLPQKELL